MHSDKTSDLKRAQGMSLCAQDKRGSAYPERKRTALGTRFEGLHRIYDPSQSFSR